MTELIRRLDPAALRGPRRLLPPRRRWLPRVRERAASVVEFPIHGFARPATVAQLLAFARWCRREPHRGGADMRPVREHLRLAWGGPGRGAGADRQPPRTEPRQDRRADPAAAAAYRMRHEGRREFARRPRQQLETRGRIRPDRVAIIPNGVDAAAFAPVRRRALRSRTILTVANLRPEKSHEDLDRCAAVLVPPIPSCRFQFAGDGPSAALKSCAPSRERRVRTVELPRPSRGRAGAPGRGRCVRLAVALRGVSERRDRSDGRRACPSWPARSAAWSI